MATNLEFISRQEITTSVSLLDFDNGKKKMLTYECKHLIIFLFKVVSI